MEYSFHFSGHKNISATHKTTFELTKEPTLTEKGDCIIGVKADFKLSELKRFLRKEKVLIIIMSGEFSEEVVAVPNKSFSSEKELVVRTSGFISKRTFAVMADKACSDFSREIIKSIKENGGKVIVRESS
ncbi:DUF371 domain-containing protein [Candidatus Woesearchaeota archaeon]|nr:MAG: DUF371 domain-containing protein [Candidatus Woesearchaeota archaeon]